MTVNKPLISMIYIVERMLPLCSAQILVDRMNPQESNIKNPPISLNRIT